MLGEAVFTCEVLCYPGIPFDVGSSLAALTAAERKPHSGAYRANGVDVKTWN